MRFVKSLVLAVVSVFLLAATAVAQAEMRYYVVPKVGTGAFNDPFRPKYTNPNELGVGWNVGPFQSMPYGLENVFLLSVNLDATQHSTLAAQTDVLSVPNPISNTVSALARSTVKTKLEAGNIPADWVTTAMSYQQVLSRVIRLVLFMQRFSNIFGLVFDAGATLDTRINQLTVNARQALNQAAQSMGADTSSIQGTTLIRAALVIVADQLFTSGIPFGDITF